MSRWLFFPSPTVSTLEVGTCTGWTAGGGTIVRTSSGWVAGTYGAGSVKLMFRTDSFGAFLQFTDGTAASAWLASHSSNGVRVTDSFSNVYDWSGGTMSVFATKYITLPLANWSGNLPASGTNSTTVELT